MSNPSPSRSAVCLLSGFLFLGVTACSPIPPSPSTNQETAASTKLAPASQSSSETVPSISTPAKRRDPYKLALDKAASAGNISQSAYSQDDWNLVAKQWQQAIELLKSVPTSSPYRAWVKPKLADYQRNLAHAKKRAAQAASSEVAFDPGVAIEIPLPPASSVPTTKPQTTSSNSSAPPREGRVFRVQIKRREGGTPVIDVTFNGQQSYEMIVDTGASGTVITQEMAATLGVSVIGKTKVDTASQQDVEVSLAYIDSIAAGGRAVKGVVVAIGGPALEIGLLGHDFFDGYDVTIRRDVVEFRPQ